MRRGWGLEKAWSSPASWGSRTVQNQGDATADSSPRVRFWSARDARPPPPVKSRAAAGLDHGESTFEILYAKMQEGVRSSLSSFQSPLGGCTRKLRRGTELELDLDPLAVRLDGVNAQIKLVRNLGRGLPFTDPLKDVKLAVREHLSRQEGAGRAAGGKAMASRRSAISSLT